MFTDIVKISLTVIGSIVLVGCDIDDSFTTTNTPVYSNGSQVRTNNQVIGTAPVYSNGGQVISGPVGRSPSPRSNEYNAGNVVGSNGPAVGVTTNRSLNATNGNVPALVPVQMQPAPVVSSGPAVSAAAPVVSGSGHASNVIPVITSPQDEPVMRSTPSPA